MCKTIEVMSHLLKIADRFCLNIVLLVRSLSSRYTLNFVRLNLLGQKNERRLMNTKFCLIK